MAGEGAAEVRVGVAVAAEAVGEDEEGPAGGGGGEERGVFVDGDGDVVEDSGEEAGGVFC